MKDKGARTQLADLRLKLETMRMAVVWTAQDHARLNSVESRLSSMESRLALLERLTLEKVSV